MTKRLSRRPLKRTVRFEIMLGREYYVIWTSELPRGQRGARFIAVLQKMNWPGQYHDRVHNPVLFQRITSLSAGYTAETQAKHALHQAQQAAYWLLKKRLKANSRSLIKWRSSVNVKLAEWETIDPPSEAFFQDWYLNAMHKLTSVLGNWKAYMEPFGYLGLGDPQTGKLISDKPETTNQ